MLYLYFLLFFFFFDTRKPTSDTDPRFLIDTDMVSDSNDTDIEMQKKITFLVKFFNLFSKNSSV